MCNRCGGDELYIKIVAFLNITIKATRIFLFPFEEIKKLKNNILTYSIYFKLFTGCQSVKDALTKETHPTKETLPTRDTCQENNFEAGEKGEPGTVEEGGT